jgi:hypothetical protein
LIRAVYAVKAVSIEIQKSRSAFSRSQGQRGQAAHSIVASFADRKSPERFKNDVRIFADCPESQHQFFVEISENGAWRLQIEE